MKKKITALLIAAALLIAFAPAASLGEGGETPVVLAANSPATASHGAIAISVPVSAAELLSYFENSGALSVVGADGEAVEPDEKVGTGARVVSGDNEVAVAVLGDTNGDGNMNVRDVAGAISAMLHINFSDASRAAADVVADGEVNARDVIAIMRLLVGFDELFGEEREYAGTGAQDISIYFDSLMHRIGRSDATVYGDRVGLIRMAKNELEDASMFVVSGEERKDVTLEVGELTNAEGGVLEAEVHAGFAWAQTIFKQLVVNNAQASENQETDYFTEALPKLDGAFDLVANESKHFVIRVKTAADDAPGYYSAPVTLRASDGSVLKSTLLRVFVWDFALDEETASDTAFGFSWSDVLSKTYKGDWDEINSDRVWNGERHEVYATWMEFLGDSRISPYKLPYDILEERADAYMSDPRVTSFCTLGGGQHEGVPNKSAEEMTEIYEKLRTNPEWLDKAYVYLVDEPCTPGGIQLSKGVYDFMTDAVPEGDFHIVVPMASNEMFTVDQSNPEHGGATADTVEYTLWYSDIFCPQSYAFTPYYSSAERSEAKKKGITLFPPGSYINRWTDKNVFEFYGNKQFQQRYDEYAESVHKHWWYICVSPTLPHPNYFKYYQGAPQRVTLWQQYMFHADGLLYWDMMQGWNGTNQKRNVCGDGDGQLIYWGEIWGQTGPVASIRLEYIRDGLEDFQYMKQLERLGVDRDEVIAEYVNRVTTGVLFYSEDYHDIENARVDLGFALEAATKAVSEQ